ncbi:MAG: NUDIX domain-containing protein [Patescibacteria group bacterium]
MGLTLNQYSSCCGYRFEGNAYPRVCQCCDNEFWDNPTPVIAVLQPIVDDELLRGLVVIRRSIKPCIGELALPGGFLEIEPWQVGGARELNEEGVAEIHPESLLPFAPYPFDSPRNRRRLMIFCVAKPIHETKLPPFRPNPETSERLIIWEPTELCFATHTEAVRRFFETL